MFKRSKEDPNISKSWSRVNLLNWSDDFLPVQKSHQVMPTLWAAVCNRGACVRTAFARRSVEPTKSTGRTCHNRRGCLYVGARKVCTRIDCESFPRLRVKCREARCGGRSCITAKFDSPEAQCNWRCIQANPTGRCDPVVQVQRQRVAVLICIASSLQWITKPSKPTLNIFHIFDVIELSRSWFKLKVLLGQSRLRSIIGNWQVFDLTSCLDDKSRNERIDCEANHLGFGHVQCSCNAIAANLIDIITNWRFSRPFFSWNDAQEVNLMGYLLRIFYSKGLCR